MASDNSNKPPQGIWEQGNGRTWTQSSANDAHQPDVDSNPTKPQEVIHKLQDMFIDVLDLEVIQSVAQNCEFNLHGSIEALMMLSEDVEIRKSPVPSNTSPRWDERGLATPRTRHLNIPELPLQAKPRKQDVHTSYLSPADLRNGDANSAVGPIKVAYKSPDNCEESDSDPDVVIEDEKEYDIAGSSVNVSSLEGAFSMLQVPYSIMPQYMMPVLPLPDGWGKPSSAAVRSAQLPSMTAAVTKLPSIKTPTDFPPEKLSSVQMLKQKSFKTLTIPEQVQKLIREGSRVMVLMRGAPGSGKSHLAMQLVKSTIGKNCDINKYVFSTDDFFVLVGRFIPNMLPQAHSWNQGRVRVTAERKWNPIFVDNTNMEVWEMKPYVEIAVKNGYILELLEPSTPWRYNESQLARKNVHSVPRQQIHNMLARFEKNLTGAKLRTILGLKYSATNKPPQPAANAPPQPVIPKSQIKSQTFVATPTDGSVPKGKAATTKKRRGKKRSKRLEQTNQTPEQPVAASAAIKPESINSRTFLAKKTMEKEKTLDSLVAKCLHNGVTVEDIMLSEKQDISKTDTSSSGYSALKTWRTSDSVFSDGINTEAVNLGTCSQLKDCSSSSEDSTDEEVDEVETNDSVLQMEEGGEWLGSDSEWQYQSDDDVEVLEQGAGDTQCWEYILVTDDLKWVYQKHHPVEKETLPPQMEGLLVDLSTGMETTSPDKLQLEDELLLNTEEQSVEVSETVNSFVDIMNRAEESLESDGIQELLSPIDASNMLNVSTQQTEAKPDVLSSHLLFLDEFDEWLLENTKDAELWLKNLSEDNTQAANKQPDTVDDQNPVSGPSEIIAAICEDAVLANPNNVSVIESVDFEEFATPSNVVTHDSDPVNETVEIQVVSSDFRDTNVGNEALENEILCLLDTTPALVSCTEQNLESEHADKKPETDACSEEGVKPTEESPDAGVTTNDSNNSPAELPRHASGQVIDLASNEDEYHSAMSSEASSDKREVLAEVHNIETKDLLLLTSGRAVPQYDLMSWVLKCKEEKKHDKEEEWEHGDEWTSDKEVETRSDDANVPRPARERRSPRRGDRVVERKAKQPDVAEVLPPELQAWGTVSEPTQSWENKDLVAATAQQDKEKLSDDPQPQRSIFASDDISVTPTLLTPHDFMQGSWENRLVTELHKIVLTESGNQDTEESGPDKVSTTSISTNTHYGDFSLVSQLNRPGDTTEPPGEVGIIIAQNRSINDDSIPPRPFNDQPVPVTLMLDKSSMTTEEDDDDIATAMLVSAQEIDARKDRSLKELVAMFPGVPHDDLREIFEKCFCNLNWTIDLLLESQLEQYTPVTTKRETEQIADNQTEASSSSTPERGPFIKVSNPELSAELSYEVLPCSSQTKKSWKKDSSSKMPLSEELLLLKRQIEESITLSDASYSEHTLRIRKLRHGEVLDMGEVTTKPEHCPPDGGSEIDESFLGAIGFAGTRTPTPQHADRSESGDGGTPNRSDMAADEEVESNSSEEEMLSITLDSGAVSKLHEKFGNPVISCTEDIDSVVTLPLSLARQIHYYLVESQLQLLEQQHIQMEHMIQEDEELARQLQEQERDVNNQVLGLQEIMDMEMALALYRTDQAQWQGKQTEDDLATKLSKQMLCDMFPKLDKEVLMEVFTAHGNSFNDTVNEVVASMGGTQEETVRTVMAPEALAAHGRSLMEQAKQESSKTKEEEEEKAESSRSLPIVVVRDPAENSSTTSPKDQAMEDANHYRAEASRHYQLRNECYHKATEAFNKGLTTVASYYSQVASLHRERIDDANARAASSLLVAHTLSRNDSTTLDLHFLHVAEAMQALDLFLDHHVVWLVENSQGKQNLFLITGRGLRSSGGKSRIRPAVEHRLRQRKLRWSVVNPGLLKVVVTRYSVLSSGVNINS